MEKSAKTKKDILFNVLRIVGVVIFLIGVTFLFIEFKDDYNHDLELEVGISSPTDECYTIEIEGELDNHTSNNVSGTLNIKLKDGKGKVATATFNNVVVLANAQLEIDTINNSVVNNLFDSENGLDHNIKIIEVNVGDYEFVEYSPRLDVAIPLMIGGVALVLVIQILISKPKKNDEIEEN